MKRSLAVVILLVQPVFAQAAEPGKFATLSRKEIAEGWILLFDGKTTFGWTAPTGSKWTIANGMLAPQPEKPGLLVTTASFFDCELSLEFRQSRRNRLQLLIGCDAQGNTQEGRGRDQIREGSDAAWWRLRIRAEGDRIERRLTLASESRPIVNLNIVNDHSWHRRSGHIGLAGNGFIIRNLKLRPINTKPLFNGKDLSGWKVFPGRKSKFSVTKEGWLSLKNGPGDLQSQGEWADFVLQLDCRTNGKYLNSGAFFRCLPGKYQQGYEAQIHNKFLDPPGKNYTLSVYDPKTHKLIGKKKVKYLASDYGTGAIYRRQPARLQASKDREWFTMTVVARGRHLATWVNGLQVTDWTDHRPLADNARRGCYLKKGPISLQGHDPTTDLNFRNLRLAELPAPAKR